jgi:hypothetical protein
MVAIAATMDHNDVKTVTVLSAVGMELYWLSTSLAGQNGARL